MNPRVELSIAGDAPRTGPAELPISETFISVQGEGKLTGVPSWFCRVSGCNLRCSWCDTPYASWKPEHSRRTLDDLIAEATRSSVRHAVLTGGEPLLFPQTLALAARLRTLGWHITFETAGTLAPMPPDDSPFPADLLSISPKLATSTPTPARSIDLTGSDAWSARHEARRISLPALQALLDLPIDRQIKFVAAAPADLAEIEALLARLHNWQPADIMLMPEGTAEPSHQHTRWVLDACLQRGWRYCHRLHITLFGHTRGT
jgi:7-carboxy-7-deazaguanine synthase